MRPDGPVSPVLELLAHRAFESAVVVVARRRKACRLAPPPLGGARLPTLAARRPSEGCRTLTRGDEGKRLIIMTDSIGVAVIGAGMAGRSHAHAYRTAQTVCGTDAPPVRLVAIADVNTDFANHTRDRYGFERAESTWQAIADADDIRAVSIVVANHLHRQIALASGKHVLCESRSRRASKTLRPWSRQTMPFSGSGHGGQEFFTYQARAFLDEIAGLKRLPHQATFADGLRNMRVEEAIVKSAATGAAVTVPR
jgi:predicted dehydrogenase